jgi:prefoldin alpha subunit
MHVAGTLAAPDRVLVDVGTGYVIEMSADRAADYCRRKIEYVRERLDEVGAVMASRQSAITQIGAVLAARR